MSTRGPRRAVAPLVALRHPVKTFSPLAPRWLRQTMSVAHPPVPWGDMVREAACVAGPVAVGFLTGQAALGGLVALGSWLAADSDRGGVLAHRAWSVGVGLAAAVIGLVLGRLTAGDPASSLLVLALVGGVAAVISAVSADLSNAGLQLLIYFAVGAGPLAAVPADRLVLATLAGGLVALAASWVQTLVQPQRDAPRQAVAAVLDALVIVVRTQGRAAPPAHDSSDLTAPAHRGRRLAGPRAGTSAAVAHAFDVLIAARARSLGRRHDLDRLSAVLIAANGVLAGLLSPQMASLPTRDADALVERLEHVRGQVLRSRAERGWQAVRHPLSPESPASDEAARDASPGDVPAERDGPLGSETDALERSVASDLPGRWPGSRRERPGALLTTALGPATRRYAVRLVVTLLVAQAVALVVPFERSYWVLMTAALVLKPDFGSVFARGVQRMAGTLVGALVGGLVFALTPQGPAIVVPAVALAFLVPWAQSRNYGLMAVFLTPLVLVFVEVSAPVGRGLVVGRVLDTVIGSLIVLLVGYLPWPSTWRSRIGVDVASFVDVVADFARVALVGDPAVVGPAGRRAQGELTDIRSRLQASLAEPTPAARTTSTWFPLITSLAQAVEDLRDVAVLATGARARGGEVGHPHDAEQVEQWLRTLAAAIRAGHDPQDLELPTAGSLAAVAEDLRAARRTVVGNEPAAARGVG